MMDDDGRSPIKSSLRAKLTRLILVQLVVLSAVGAGMATYQSYAEFRDSLSGLEAQARQALSSKARLLIQNQSIALRTLLGDYALSDIRALVAGTVASDGDVEYGVVRDAEQNVVAVAVAEGLDPSFPAGEALASDDTRRFMAVLGVGDDSTSQRAGTRELSVWGQTIVEHTADVRDAEGVSVGSVRYGLSTRRTERALQEARVAQVTALRRALVATAMVAIVALVVGLMISLRESRRIVEPVLRLTAAASALARGDRSVRVAIRSGDELQVLGDAFDRMVADLSESYERLERSNAKLLEQIAVREQAELERRDAEQQLAQSQKMEAIGQLAGGVAHDFNNLLTIIQGHTSLIGTSLTRGLSDQSVLREHLRQIEEASKRAANLTRQLLTFSRRDVQHPTVVALNDVVVGMQPMLRRLLREDVELRVDLAPDAPSLEIDVGRLEQVIMNLAINACDAMPEGGTLSITSQCVTTPQAQASARGELPVGTYAQLAVHDTGSGIAPEHRDRVFEPFFTTKPAGKGTGLGLALVHGIVRRAGGFIELDSTPERGTTFRLHFPAVQRTAVSASTEVLASSPRGHGELILLCEDDDAVRNVTQAFLDAHGYRVASFCSPHDARAYASQHRPQIELLVTDVVMPEMSGPELARAIGQSIPGLPVLFLSGYTAGALESYGLADGSEQLLHKPFSGEELCSRVHRAMQWKHAQTA